MSRYASLTRITTHNLTFADYGLRPSSFCYLPLIDTCSSIRQSLHCLPGSPVLHTIHGYPTSLCISGRSCRTARAYCHDGFCQHCQVIGVKLQSSYHWSTCWKENALGRFCHGRITFGDVRPGNSRHL